MRGKSALDSAVSELWEGMRGKSTLDFVVSELKDDGVK